jgi:hypothetical protein
MKHLLTESCKSVEKIAGFNPSSPAGIKHLITEKSAFDVYIRALSEGLRESDLEGFKMLAENTRRNLLENSMFQLNPYETLTLPILRVFYPKLIAKELVNVMPIDKPDVVKGFIRASFKKYGEASFSHAFPSIATDISRGPTVGVTVAKTATSGTTDILAEASLSSATSHLEKIFKITAVTDSTGNSTAVNVISTVDGNIYAQVTVAGQSDVVTGFVDFLNGTLTWSSATGVVTSVTYQAVCSLEENVINPQTKFEIDKIRLTVTDRRISTEWSLNLEQDVKSLFDLSLQSEIANIIGEQIALDIDSEIIADLIAGNSANNTDAHTDTFSRTPDSTFTWGQKMWFENIIPKLNNLSAVVYNSTQMGGANTIAANPVDAAILESLNTFEYDGNSVDGGTAGYRSATVSGGKWKVLVSSIVPQGTMILKYRSEEAMRAVYFYAPYVPAVLSPYPLGATPSLTVMSRYATKMIRPEGVSILNITA